ncbi:MAG: hypothetical protein ABS913_09070 [Desemzia incerta]|uniref:hypothetical protein n=1 Tax=Desemzia incerta TaxID=82801 RepID=UPI003314DB56
MKREEKRLTPEKLRKSAIRTETILFMADAAVYFGHGGVKLNAHGRKTAKKKITQEHPHEIE